MKIFYLAIIVLFASCSNGNGPERDKRIKELLTKNDTITVKDFYDTDTIIYVHSLSKN